MPAQQRSKVLQDVLMLATLVVCVVLLSLRFQWSEWIERSLHRYEYLELDELVVGLMALLCGVCWFSYRRWLEARLHLQERETIQAQRDSLFVQNRELSQKIISAQEDERRVLARELHDELAQTCTAIRYEAAYITQALPHEPQQALQAALRIESNTVAMHQMTRNMLKRLRPEHLDSLGLEQALRDLCAAWEKQCGVTCICDIHGSLDSLGDYLKISLYRVVQESLTNIARHAQARLAKVKLNVLDDCLTLDVRDDGQGISDAHLLTQGLGWVGMQERVASLSGHFEWRQLEPGLQISCLIPLTGANA